MATGQGLSAEGTPTPLHVLDAWHSKITTIRSVFSSTCKEGFLLKYFFIVMTWRFQKESKKGS